MASPKRGTVPASSLTPLAKERPCTSRFSEDAVYSTGSSFGFLYAQLDEQAQFHAFAWQGLDASDGGPEADRGSHRRAGRQYKRGDEYKPAREILVRPACGLPWSALIPLPSR